MSVRPVAFNTYKDNFLDKRVSAAAANTVFRFILSVIAIAIKHHVVKSMSNTIVYIMWYYL